MFEIVYFSNVSGNTKRFVEKLPFPAKRIPLHWDVESPLLASKEYVLFVPTYGGGNDRHTVPKQVVKFLNIKLNRDLLRGVVGMGNTNFGDHYCKAAEMVSEKTGAPLIDRVEIFGTPEDVERIIERLEKLWKTTATTS